MKFHVRKPKSPLSLDQVPGFILMQDNWNDYSFQTQYQLYYLDGINEPVFIDSVKILKKGQIAADTLQLNDDFEKLTDQFCSIGQSLDYYERLSSLGVEIRDKVLLSLRDIVKSPDIIPVFENEEGWSVSLFRDYKKEYADEFIALAKALLSQDYTKVAAEDLEFRFHMTGWENPISFDFTSPKIGIPSPFNQRAQTLPSRIVALIGRNGSGKSTFLARLARVSHASVKDRTKKLKELGRIEPEGIGFPRIITFSYSAFDSFHLPGVTVAEREQIVNDMEKGEGRFIFCGLRDITKELKMDISQQNPFSDYQEHKDRLSQTLLKPINVLADEFVRSLALIEKNNNVDLFNSALEIVSSDPSFGPTYDVMTFETLKAGANETFLRWSTGHKIVMQIIVNLVAYTVPRSLVLFDEPETHLHPPLLATLMHTVRHILDNKKAFAIVATHSPVVVQETLSKHVIIVRREGELTDTVQSKIETFGENIGTLTAEVFGFVPRATDYHKVLRRLVKEFDDIEKIEALFARNGLSMQARAYVMSLFASKGEE